MPPLPAVKQFLESVPPGTPGLHELPLNVARDAAAAMFLQLWPGKDDVPVADRTIPGPGGDIPVRIYGAAADAPRPGIVFFHGGAWILCNLETHDALCRQIAKEAGCVVVSVDYRLAPEHVFPAAFDDCFAALQWTASNAASLGIDPDRIAVGGDSAGGNLAAAVTLKARDLGGPKIHFQILIYPVTDADLDSPSYLDAGKDYLLTRDTMRWAWDSYVPDPKDRDNPLASPLRAESLHGLPPAFVLTAEFDPLRHDGEAYARKLAGAGVPTEHRHYEGLIHGFLMYDAVFPQAAEGRADVIRAIANGLR